MSVFFGLYVLRVLLVPARYVDVISQQWRRLRTSLFDPYAPELHYMRGPGPRWREKNHRNRST